MWFAERTWTELNPAETVVILPVGAVEAHGPHLPLGTDNIIAEAMAREAVSRLSVPALILPTLCYTAAGFASEFPGTINLRPETVRGLLHDLVQSLRHFRLLAIANAHFDPDNVATLRELGSPFVVFPDLTRRQYAIRLSEEFQSGACHAGQYEGSIVRAERPDLVGACEDLPDNPRSLVEAIRSGKRSFAEAGGPQAYFGYPSRITAEEGRRTLAILGQILAEAIEERLKEIAER